MTGPDMSSSMVADTIREALIQKKGTDGLVLHSDQEAQYSAKQTSTILKNTMFLRLYPAPAFLMKTQQGIVLQHLKTQMLVSHSITLTGYC